MKGWTSASRLVATIGLRLVLPLGTATLSALWLIRIGTPAAIVGGILLAASVLVTWFGVGFVGDPTRAGHAQIVIPVIPRLALELLIPLGGALVAWLGLHAVSVAIVLAALALVHGALRPRPTPQPVQPPASTPAEVGSTPLPTPDWSRRSADGSFEFGRTIVVPGGLDEVWNFIWDFKGVARCIPGCEDVQEHDPHHKYTAAVRKKLGPFLIRMPLEIEIVDHRERSWLCATVVGRDQRLRSEVEQRLNVKLGDHPAGTRLLAEIAVEIRGVLATVDAHLIERNLDQTIGEFTQALNAEFADRTTPASG